MSAVRPLTALPAKFKPKEPRVDYRLPVKQSLSDDLELIAYVRTEVNKAVGDGTKISVTEMLLIEAEELRDDQFADWGGKPVDGEAKQKIIDRLIAEHKAGSDGADEEKPRAKRVAAGR